MGRRPKAVDVLEEPERRDSDEKRMPDRGVAPVEDRRRWPALEHASEVEVVVLDGVHGNAAAS